MEILLSLVYKARTRLIEFRTKSSDQEISVHVNAFELVLCLTEFGLKTNPARKISLEEEQWFNAGRYIELIFGNSEWEDLVDLYFNIVDHVRKRNFFR